MRYLCTAATDQLFGRPKGDEGDIHLEGGVRVTITRSLLRFEDLKSGSYYHVGGGGTDWIRDIRTYLKGGGTSRMDLYIGVYPYFLEGEMFGSDYMSIPVRMRILDMIELLKEAGGTE